VPRQVLIGSVAGALLANGTMPAWLGGLVIGRDAALLAGTAAARAASFGWAWPGTAAFFRTADASYAAPDGAVAAVPTAHAGVQGVPYMRPLLVSKANTVLQLLLLGAYLTEGLQREAAAAAAVGAPQASLILPLLEGLPAVQLLPGLQLATAATTVGSLAAYAWLAARGKLLK
jgi:cardiolipin synthase